MKLAIIGHGYVGLVTAAVFADLGNTVWCVGRTPEKIEALKNGISPFYEPGLEEVVKKNVVAKRLIFTLSYSDAVRDAEIIFICVGTPSLANGEADLSSVFAAAGEIGKNLSGYAVVACKSTVPVGTNREVEKVINAVKLKNVQFDIASCPEFLREGTALHDTLNPDRIVIGADTQKAKDALLRLHEPIDGRFVITTIETAEMIKYAANTILATKISFANAVSFLCEKVGADVEKVMEGIGLDKRIGRQFLRAGVGYGGSCFPKDVKALIAMTKKYRTEGGLFEAVEKINKLSHEHFVEKVRKFFKGDLKNKRLAVLGLAFKPDTDDMRDAPSVPVIKDLVKLGARVFAYDPKAEVNAKRVLADIPIVYVSSVYEACKGSDAVLVLTEWNEFKQLDLIKMKKLLKNPVVFDGRNIYEPENMKKLGFKYFGTGRN
ncbi:MAG: UDP-glucose/GDP-mannose dehydrogenase family protein [Patescibacteria group bacterium]|nr:UDP-glucose/GDP-mannose dehydrogenase family protein [Patescibacteria group bacterium]